MSHPELLIMRHAKSSWTVSGLADIERPLNQRGINDAKAMGEWLQQQGLTPQLILCSSAIRAQQTLQHLLLPLPSQPRTMVDECFYACSATDWITYIQRYSTGLQRLMIIGHNPELESLLDLLCCDQLPLTNKGKLFTTANIARLQVLDSWDQLSLGSCQLLQFQRPKAL